MTEFASAFSYQHFASSVMSKWRYTRNSEQAAFLAAVLASSAPRRENIEVGSILYRAQEGIGWPVTAEQEAKDPNPRAYGPKRMKPRPNRAPEGRVNPRGIPCLYMSTRLETAVAEIRPWVGASVSVAEMKVLRPLVIMNCTTEDRSTTIYFSEPDATERERACWRDIDRAFARPVERSDQIAEYAPTQVLAEMFKQQGLDGIGYRSSLGPGHNIALFDLSAADVIAGVVWSVDKIKVKTSQAGNPYVVTKSHRKRKTKTSRSKTSKRPSR